MSPAKGLARVLLVFDAGQGNDYRNAYKDIVDALTLKDGAGEESQWFENPYEDGDGYESTALAVGNGHISTLWTTRDSTGLMVNIGHSQYALSIAVDYESSLWPAESNRRKAKAFEARAEHAPPKHRTAIMLRKPTTLILGAGASAPYGYLLGGPLVDQILRESSNPAGTRPARRDTGGLQLMHHHGRE